MYMPSEAAWTDMDGAGGGIWVDESSSGEIILVLKMSVDVLKAIYQGAVCNIIVSVISHGGVRVRCVCLEVVDDQASPLAAFRTQWTRREQTLFKRFLSLAHVRVFLYDELCRCVAEMSATIDAASSKEVATDLSSTAPHYVGEDRQIREAALDLFQADLEASHIARPIAALVHRKLSLSLKCERTINIVGITFDGAGWFRLDDAAEGAEGSGLEQSIHQLLDDLFGERLYRSPQVQHGPGRRELIDIMGIGPEAPVLIESKVRAVLAAQPQSSLEKHARRMDKAVEKGLKQLGGAIRRLRSGVEVYRHSGEAIAVTAADLVNIEAIVLISSMNPQMNWERITSQVLEAAKTHQAFFHVLDLTELRKLVGISGSTVRLHLNLIKRFLAMQKAGSAYIRCRFPMPKSGEK